MKYTVVWLKAAQDKLAELWLQANDRTGLTAASNRIDQELRVDPYLNSQGHAHGYRFRAFGLLTVTYTVSDDDQLVTVGMVWLS